MTIKQSWVPFYAWWVQVSLLAVGAYWAFQQGIFAMIYHADVSHITQVIAAVLLIGIARIGWLAYIFAAGPYWGAEDRYTKMRKHIEEWNEVGTMFMQLGLLGTVIGFAYLSYSVLSGIDFAAGFDAAKIVPALLTPLGTVFFATAVGVGSAVVLKIQTMLFLSFTGIEDSDYEY